MAGSDADSPDPALQRLQSDNDRLAKEVKRLVRTEVELFESHRQLDQQLRIYEHLHQVGRKLNATFDRAEILRLAVHFPVYELGFQRAVVLVRRDADRLVDVAASEGYYDAASQAALGTVSLDLEAHHPDLADGAELLLRPTEAGVARPLAVALGMTELAAYPVGGQPGRYEGLLVVGNQADKVHLHSRLEVGSGILIGLANFASHVSTAMKHAAAFAGLLEERRLLEAKVQERTRELQRAHERLLRFEKDSLEMQMAGGFAHEMRNAVGAIETLVAIALDDVTGQNQGSLPSQNAELLERLFVTVRSHLPKPVMTETVALVRSVIDNEEQIGRILGGVRSASQRALGITTSLLEYSRLGRSVRGTDRVDLARLVEHVLANTRDELERLAITLVAEHSAALWVRGSESHFYSIVSNLVNNACDALAENGGGKRQLDVGLVTDDDHIVIRVADTGHGIPKEILPRIFEPFYSTKPKTGTGLGLGVCKKLIELYDGVLEIETEVGRGTVFTVRFPARELRGP